MTSVQNETKTTLEQLLRSEMAAVEGYAQAIPRSDATEKPTLASLREDHELSAGTLRNLLAAYHDVEALDAGWWGMLAKAFTGTASLLGKRAGLQALKLGEARVVERYEKALDRSQLAPEAKEVILGTLLPRGRAHLDTLERLVNVA